MKKQNWFPEKIGIVDAITGFRLSGDDGICPYEIGIQYAKRKHARELKIFLEKQIKKIKKMQKMVSK